MASPGRQLAWAAVALSGALLACNAILGVEDVTLRPDTSGGTGSSGSGDDEGEGEGEGEGEPGGGSKLREDGGTLRDRASLALGLKHGCARLVTGAVRCWGINDDGQLGLGVAFDGGGFEREALVPKDVPGLGQVTAVAAGLHHSCALREGGAVSCWGWNAFGQLGDDTEVSRVEPVAVLGVTDAVAIGCGNAFTCVVRKGGAVGCFGSNSSGQLGDGTTAEQRKVVTVQGLSGAVAVAAGYTHACALIEDGTVQCWGNNRDGQLGDGTTQSRPRPVKVTGLRSAAVQLAAAASFTCARLAAGEVHCWGDDRWGQLGRGAPSVAANATPAAVGGLEDATFVWTGFDHACAVRAGGAVVCWGRAGGGQVGGAMAADASAPAPRAVSGVADAYAVFTGGARSCALTEDDRALCWGENDRGQLGSGTKDPAPAPVPMQNVP